MWQEDYDWMKKSERYARRDPSKQTGEIIIWKGKSVFHSYV